MKTNLITEKDIRQKSYKYNLTQSIRLIDYSLEKPEITRTIIELFPTEEYRVFNVIINNNIGTAKETWINSTDTKWDTNCKTNDKWNYIEYILLKICFNWITKNTPYSKKMENDVQYQKYYKFIFDYDKSTIE